jgi:hypothetical protein
MAGHSTWDLPRRGGFLTFFAPVVGAFGLALAWAYQVGSARLGVVDLFACEISTLCRVATVIVQFADRWKVRAGSGRGSTPAPAPHPVPAKRFTSEENYFPVFGSGTRDLQTLEARVVVNITAFYTYMKAVRDMMRALADIDADSAELRAPSNKTTGAEPWYDATRNVIRARGCPGVPHCRGVGSTVIRDELDVSGRRSATRRTRAR